MTKTPNTFLYHVRFDPRIAGTLRITIGYYDPERFEGQGGHVFALTTGIIVDDRSYGEPTPEYEVKVEQSGNSFVDLETAVMRAEVGRQALEMGQFIQSQLDSGETLHNIAAFLKDALHDGEPVSEPFRWSGAAA